MDATQSPNQASDTLRAISDRLRSIARPHPQRHPDLSQESAERRLDELLQRRAALHHHLDPAITSHLSQRVADSIHAQPAPAVVVQRHGLLASGAAIACGMVSAFIAQALIGGLGARTVACLMPLLALLIPASCVHGRPETVVLSGVVGATMIFSTGVLQLIDPTLIELVASIAIAVGMAQFVLARQIASLEGAIGLHRDDRAARTLIHRVIGLTIGAHGCGLALL